MKLFNWLSNKLKSFSRKIRERFAGYSTEMIVLVVYVVFIVTVLVFLFMMIQRE